MGKYTSTSANGYVTTNQQNQGATENDWVKYRVITKDKSPINIDSSTDKDNLYTSTEIKQYEKILLWNSTDGAKIIEVGSVSYDSGTGLYSTDISSANFTTASTNAHILTKRKDATIHSDTTSSSLVLQADLTEETLVKDGESVVVYNSSDGYKKKDNVTVSRSLDGSNIKYTIDISSLSLSATPTEAYIIKPRADVSFVTDEDKANVNDIVLDVDTDNTTADVVKTNYVVYNESQRNRIKNATTIDLDTSLAQAISSITETYQDPTSINPFNEASTSEIAFYRFENNANDEHGSYNGTEHGSPSYAIGKFGQCIDLDGTDDYITTGLSIDNSFAISCWIYVRSLSDNQRIWNFTGSNNGICGLHIGSSSGNVHCILNGNPQKSFVPDLNQFYHVVVSYDGSSMKMYVNANEVTENNGESWTEADTNLGIGARTELQSQFFNGQIDQFRVFNRALTESEVTQLYNEGKYKYDITLSTTQSSAPTTAIIRPTISDILSIDTNNTAYDSVNDLVEVYYNEVTPSSSGRCIQVKWEAQQVSDENSKIQVDLWK